MGAIKSPVPGKLFVGMISADADLFTQAAGKLVCQFSAVDLKSEIIHFSHSAYYSQEMGEGLLRQWISIKEFIAQDDLPQVKLWTNKLDAELADNGRRRINLDPGYLTAAKVVLASTKDFSHRIYLSQGIYAEVTLSYNRSLGWTPCKWTYPDYKDNLCFFKKLRQLYFNQR